MIALSAPFPGSGDSTSPQVPLWYLDVGFIVFIVGVVVVLLVHSRDRGGMGRLASLLVAAALYALVWPVTAVVLLVKGTQRLRDRR